MWRNDDLIANDVRVPPVNIGPRSTPNYADLAATAVKTLGDGTKVFAGQRDDAFFVDLGSIFDLAGLRPFNMLHDIPLPAAPGIDDVDGFNTNSIALQIPLQTADRRPQAADRTQRPRRRSGHLGDGQPPEVSDARTRTARCRPGAPGSRCRGSVTR